MSAELACVSGVAEAKWKAEVEVCEGVGRRQASVASPERLAHHQPTSTAHSESNSNALAARLGHTAANTARPTAAAAPSSLHCTNSACAPRLIIVCLPILSCLDLAFLYAPCAVVARCCYYFRGGPQSELAIASLLPLSPSILRRPVAMSSTLDSLLDPPAPLDATTRAEFEDDFQHESSGFLAAARKRAKHGLTHSRLRSVYWRLFLQLLDGRDMSLWLEQLRAHRRVYDELLRKYNLKPAAYDSKQQRRPAEAEEDTSTKATSSAIPPNPLTNPAPLSDPSPPLLPLPTLTSPTAASAAVADLKINNPLSTASSSPWQQYFHSTELSGTIQQDLDRTYAELAYYQSEAVQQLMLNVLLVWAKLNRQYEYRQGMNELLAPIVLTVFRDNRSGTWQDGLLGELLDRKYAEHDVYALFNSLMLTMAPFFAKIDSSRNTTSQAYPRPHAHDTSDVLFSSAPPAPSSQSAILLKCHHIHHVLLAQHDAVLYKHLNAQDVQPQLYGLRWYRLLFAREFHVIDVCTIWDVLFSQEVNDRRHSSAGGGGGGYVMADYFTIAMLYYVRGQLLQGDNTACLRRLLKFPPVEDMRGLIDRALFFTAPQQAQRGAPGGTNGSAAGVDLPSVQQEHREIQRFIAEYGDQLENSYLDDPLGPLKRSGHAKAAKIADGLNKLRSKAGGGNPHKSMPAAVQIPTVSPPAPLQHSQSASSLNQHPHSSTPSPSSMTAASSPSHAASLASPRPLPSTTSPASVHSSATSVPFLLALQQDMGEKLHSVIHTLTAEYGRVHRARTQLQSTAESSGDARVQLNGAKVEEEIQAQEKALEVSEEKQPHDGLNISVELDDANRLNGHSALAPLTASPPAASSATPASSSSSVAASFDLQLFSSSLADLQHIADVLLGRLTYTPQHAHAAAEGEAAVHNLQSPSASHVFFAPLPVDDPKARLAQLLSEKEAREQQQQHSSSAVAHPPSEQASHHLSSHSSHAQFAPALPFPAVKRGSLSVVPQSRSAASQADSASASPLSAPLRPTSSLPPPPLLPAPASPSLFDSTAGASSGANGANNSARALLSSLLGGEKRSVFED